MDPVQEVASLSDHVLHLLLSQEEFKGLPYSVTAHAAA